MLIPKLAFVLLFVKDPLKSGEFYSVILGLKPVEQSPTFVMFVLENGVKLGLWSHKTAEPLVTAQAGAAEIAFSHEDIDTLFMQWKQLAVPMAQIPTDMDFGRTFVALDPDGHRIRIYKMRDS